jgi:hypothetical protein
MVDVNVTNDSDRFNVVFQKLDEMKVSQDDNFKICMEQSAEANETIALFKEFQESIIQSSYTTFTNV